MFQQNDDRQDPMDGDYIGNIWGWKISYLGLALILIMLAMMIYRHIAMDKPFGAPEPQQQEEVIQNQ